jgi:hypothetical protein
MSAAGRIGASPAPGETSAKYAWLREQRVSVVAREERGEWRDSLGFRPAQVSASAGLSSGAGEDLANPRSR